MIGSGHDDHVHSLIVEQRVVVGVLRRCRARFPDGEVHVVVAQVADCGGLLIAVLEECVVYLVAAIAESDVAHAHALVGAEDPRVAQCRAECRGPREITSCHVGHNNSPKGSECEAWAELHLAHRVGRADLPKVEVEPALVSRFRQIHQVERIGHFGPKRVPLALGDAEGGDKCLAPHPSDPPAYRVLLSYSRSCRRWLRRSGAPVPKYLAGVAEPFRSVPAGAGEASGPRAVGNHNAIIFAIADTGSLWPVPPRQCSSQKLRGAEPKNMKGNGRSGPAARLSELEAQRHRHLPRVRRRGVPAQAGVGLH